MSAHRYKALSKSANRTVMVDRTPEDFDFPQTDILASSINLQTDSEVSQTVNIMAANYTQGPNSSHIPMVVLANGSSVNASFGQPPHFDDASLTKIIVLSIMFVVSLIGNVATLIQMRRLRRRKSTINTLIVNLAVADLLVTFFCIAGDAVWVATVQWLAGNIICKVFKFMQVRRFVLVVDVVLYFKCCWHFNLLRYNSVMVVILLVPMSVRRRQSKEDEGEFKSLSFKGPE